MDNRHSIDLIDNFCEIVATCKRQGILIDTLLDIIAIFDWIIDILARIIATCNRIIDNSAI